MDKATTDTGIDRRRFLKRAATVAWATPVIVTLLAESASASHPSGCIHDDAECGVWDTSLTPDACADDPAGSGSSTNCCLGTNRCRFSVKINGEPCICR